MKRHNTMNFRRYYVPESMVFITQVVQNRQTAFEDESTIALLRTTLHNVKTLYPFMMIGYVFLPDHLHLLIKPEGTITFSQIMQSFKGNFTSTYKRMRGIQSSLHFWQRRFYDHIIRNETDFQRHLDYVHYNPVKHSLVSRPEDWPHSSFLHWKAKGVYADQWGWFVPKTVEDFDWSGVE